MTGALHSEVYAVLLRRLKRARISAGITQRQAALALGKHQSFVSKCESGERRIDIIELRYFAALYRTTINQLLESD